MLDLYEIETTTKNTIPPRERKKKKKKSAQSCSAREHDVKEVHILLWSDV